MRHDRERVGAHRQSQSTRHEPSTTHAPDSPPGGAGLQLVSGDGVALGPLARRLRFLGLLLTVAAVAFQTTAYLVNEFVLDARIDQLRLGDLPDGRESGVFTWMSASAMFSAGLFALILAVALPHRRRLFGLLAAVLWYYSLDDSVELHERAGTEVDSRLTLPSVFSGAADFLILAPIALLLAALLWIASGVVHPDAKRLVQSGLGLLAASVLVDEGLKLATDALERRGIDLAEKLRLALEEGLELAAATVLATGLLVALITVVAPRHPNGGTQS